MWNKQKKNLKSGETGLEISLWHSSVFPGFSFCLIYPWLGAGENGNQEILYRNLPSLAKEQSKEQTRKTEKTFFPETYLLQTYTTKKKKKKASLPHSCQLGNLDFYFTRLLGGATVLVLEY